MDLGRPPWFPTCLVWDPCPPSCAHTCVYMCAASGQLPLSSDKLGAHLSG